MREIDGCADLSMAAIEAALRSLEEHLSCGVCKKALGERIKQLIVQWSVVKVRIEPPSLPIPYI